MKNLEKKIALLLVFIATSMSAQMGVGTRTPHPDAMLEVATTNKGILLPRVALTATTAVAPLSAHVAGMTVYNTATTGDVSPGYYYNDGSKWVKLATGQGVKGDTGASAYQSAVAGGYTGTEAQWLASLVGAAGKSAYQIWKDAGNTGTETDYLASLKGEAGANGKSAYQIWKDAGNTGTESEFLIAIKGVAGTNGIEGKSAYQIWKDAGNTGSESDFLLAIKGDTGAQGPAGANGKTVLNGTTNPVTSTGTAGDFYINTTDNTIFGPKDVTTGWPATGTSLVGSAGSGATFKSVTLSKNASYTAIVASEVTLNNVTTITFIGSSPANFTISNLPSGAENVGKILNIYNAGGSNITASFNRAGDGSAQSLTINSTRGFSFVWDGQGWARTSY